MQGDERRSLRGGRAPAKDGDRDTFETPLETAFLSPTCHACGLCAAPRAELAWQQRSNVSMAE